MGRTASRLDRVRELLSKITRVLPHIIVGGGVASAMYYPEGMNAIGALIIAYALAKAAAKDLAKTGDKKKARLAEEVAETTEKALEKAGIDRNYLEQLLFLNETENKK